MNKENNLYCRFENFCYHFLQDETVAVKEKSWDTPIEDVYVEYFTNISSLKTRVLELYDIWMKKHEFYYKPGKAYYPGFIIFNQQKKYKIIGFCPHGWYLSNNGLLNYIYSYVIKLDYNKSSKNLRKIQGKGYDFDISQDYGDYEMSLLSEDLMDLELKHFLEEMEITEEIKQNVYYPEMIRRGYINVLNET